jgi:hypothetical protein
MKKGEKIRARVWSKSLGLPVDAVLSVKGPTGGAVLLSENSSDMVEEPVLGWSATGDGEYLLSVADLLHRGGPGFEFVLEVAPPRPVCTITLTDAKPVRVEVGKTTTVKAKVTLSGGWTEPLMARILGTPEGVYSPEVTVPEKGGEIELSLHAAANAPAGSAPAGVSLWTKASPPTFVSATFPVRGELRRGHSQSDFAKDFWISVVAPGTPPPPAPVKK